MSSVILNEETKVVPIDSVQPHPRNVNRGDVAAIQESITHNGFFGSLIVQRSTGHILAGTHRWRAANQSGFAELPVTFVDVDDATALRIMLADNRTSRLGQDDPAELAALLQEIHADAGSLLGTAFTDDALAAMLAELGLDDKPEAGADPGAQTDRADELREKWGTERGQIWRIPSKTVPGKAHRLMCGDSTSAEDVVRLMGGETAGICVTSPPYAQQREYGDAELMEDWDGLMRGVFGNLPMSEDGQVLVNLGLIHKDGEWVPYWDEWLAWMGSQGWRRFGWYVWDKISATFKANDGRLWVSHEWIFHFNRKTSKCVEWVECKHAGEDRNEWGQRKPEGHVARLSTPGKIKSHRPPDSVVRIQRETNNSDEDVRRHPARFPVALPDYLIKTWPGDVFEPFCGSGTTMVAAEQLGRACYGMEIDSGYAAIILERLTGMGLEPHRAIHDEEA